MSSQADIQENITARIIGGLQSVILPWKKPWRNDPNCGPAANVVSHRNYSGINPILLDLGAQMHGFNSRYWGTYEQWKNQGGNVQKRPSHVNIGQWGTNVVFFRQVKKTMFDAFGEKKTESFPLMRFYTVFNLDQVDGEKLDRFRPSNEPANEFPSFEQAEQVIAATKANIRYGGNRVVYSRPYGTFPRHSAGDHIRMPEWR